jgi:hypothetical protein
MNRNGVIRIKRGILGEHWKKRVALLFSALSDMGDIGASVGDDAKP